MKRIQWIDFLRGMAMIMIFMFHTEIYYKNYDITPYCVYTTNAIVLFYFISGYLFYRPQLIILKKKFLSIGQTMLFPYFIFTFSIAIIKPLLLKQQIDWQYIILNIIYGRASWFIVALIVAEFIFSVILHISRGKHIWLSTVALLCSIIYFNIPLSHYTYWQWENALLAFVFLYVGYLFHQFNSFFNIIKNKLYSSILLITLIIIKIYEYNANLPMRIIDIENVYLFIADMITWLIFIFTIIDNIPKCRIIEWTGRHSIIYYFLCGGCPMIVSILLNKIGIAYNGYFYRYFLALILAYFLATGLALSIIKYVPFLVGKKH